MTMLDIDPEELESLRRGGRARAFGLMSIR